MSDAPLITLAVVMFCASVLDLGGLWGAAYAGSRPGARRTSLAGIRNGKLMASDEAWRVGHTEALRWAKLGALSLVVPGVVVLLLLGVAPGAAAVLETLLFVAGLVLLFLTVRAAHRAVDAGQAGSPSSSAR